MKWHYFFIISFTIFNKNVGNIEFTFLFQQVEKQRTNMSMKSQQCESAKNEYADQLQRTNELQRQHYRSGLPEVFRQLQELDEKRIKNIKNFIRSSVEIERNVYPIINKCLDGIVKAADSINEKDDSLLVIEKYKTGFAPPEDIPFEDLAKGGGSDSGSSPSINSIQVSKSRDGGYTVKGTVTGKSMKKRAGIFNLFTSRGVSAVFLCCFFFVLIYCFHCNQNLSYFFSLFLFFPFW